MQPANRIEQYLDFMLAMVRADGVVDREEKNQLVTMMVEGLGLREDLVSRYREALEADSWPQPSDEELAAIGEGLSPASLGQLVRDAYAMAAADGNIGEAELALVRRFLAANGIPEERFPGIDEWARISLEVAHKGERLFRREP